MSVQFNHALLAAHDWHVCAAFFAQVFGLAAPTLWGPFASVSLGGGAHLQFAESAVESIQMQHLAFLVDDGTFDRIFRRLQGLGIDHWADPQMTLPGQINTHHGGRGVYFRDPAGHGLEVLTRPYGSDG